MVLLPQFFSQPRHASYRQSQPARSRRPQDATRPRETATNCARANPAPRNPAPAPAARDFFVPSCAFPKHSAHRHPQARHLEEFPNAKSPQNFPALPVATKKCTARRRVALRETICRVSPAARAFTTTLSAINFDNSLLPSSSRRSGCAAPRELGASPARNSFARPRLLSISKRKAYPESHCGKKDGAASACFCSNTRAMAFRSKDKLSASRSFLSFADFAGAPNFTAYNVSGKDVHSFTLDCCARRAVSSEISAMSALPSCESSSARNGGTPNVTSITSTKGRPLQQSSLKRNRICCACGTEPSAADFSARPPFEAAFSRTNGPVPSKFPCSSLR